MGRGSAVPKRELANFSEPQKWPYPLQRLVSQTSTAPWFAWAMGLSLTAARNSPTPGIGIRRQRPGPTRPQLSLPSSETQNGSGETCDSQTDIPVASPLPWVLYGLMFSSYSFFSRLVAFRTLKILTDSPCAVKHTTNTRSLAEWPTMISRCSSIE